MIERVRKLVDPFSTYSFEADLELRSVETLVGGRLYYKVECPHPGRRAERVRCYEAALRVNKKLALARGLEPRH